VPTCHAHTPAETRVGQNVPHCANFYSYTVSGLCGRPGLARGHPLSLEGIREGLEVAKVLIGLLGPRCGAGPVLPLQEEQRLSRPRSLRLAPLGDVREAHQEAVEQLAIGHTRLDVPADVTGNGQLPHLDEDVELGGRKAHEASLADPVGDSLLVAHRDLALVAWALHGARYTFHMPLERGLGDALLRMLAHRRS